MNLFGASLEGIGGDTRVALQFKRLLPKSTTFQSINSGLLFHKLNMVHYERHKTQLKPAA